jgi:MFS family permease
MVAVGAFAYAVIEGPKSGWGSPLIVALLAAAAVSGFVFVAVERCSADPMMDLSLFRDRTYSLAIVTIFMVLFSTYGMLLLATQYLQNVRGYSAAQTGLMILPFSLGVAILSPIAGHLVGQFGSRRPVLFGLVALVLGLLSLIASGDGSVAFVLLGFALSGVGAALCVTPTTTIAMTSVPPQRAGMASGIMSAQRAIGSTVGYAVLGSVLAAWLAATLDHDLLPVVPDAAERQEIAAKIVASANPRAQVAEIVPRRPISHPDPKLQEAITAAADRDFVQGIRAGLLVAIVLLALVFLAGWRWFPRGTGSLAEAKREEIKLKTTED